MKTQEQIREALPERLRRFTLPIPTDNVDEANQVAAYFCAALQEAAETIKNTPIQVVSER